MTNSANAKPCNKLSNESTSVFAVTVSVLKVGGIFVHKEEIGDSRENPTPKMESIHVVRNCAARETG